MAFSKFRQAQFRLYRLLEPRALFEWQSFFAFKPILKYLKKGDGHSVVVFPGFVSSDRATRPLRSFLKDLGYRTYGWGLGTNLLFNESLEAEMIALVNEVYEKSGRKVSLVGWSLGGIYAREVAKACKGKIRCVITLGSPISGNTKHSNAHSLFQALNGKPNKIDVTRYLSLNTPPDVPTTSIYSKTDGIVAWEGSVQKRGEFTENVEVPASHLGIGVNPLALYVVANRLAEPEGNWSRFNIAGFKKLIYRRPSKRTQTKLFAATATID
ncbi:alpha/beta hydrolase [Arenicella sp. 4NH20-0111]|uniref:esterase/lipase family protein n=1 Tax=Arenicella sp. 4NH20-0111 TaxID=3127648 RepID=UPI003106A6A8